MFSLSDGNMYFFGEMSEGFLHLHVLDRGETLSGSAFDRYYPVPSAFLSLPAFIRQGLFVGRERFRGVRSPASFLSRTTEVWLISMCCSHHILNNLKVFFYCVVSHYPIRSR